MKVTIHCGFCSESAEAEIDLPDGWKHHVGGIDDEHDGFCPSHSPVAAFADAQCAGCVGGWGDCPMWQAFDGSRPRTITDADLTTLERGICPRRVNGTMSVVLGGGVEAIDISEQATHEAGKAFADAIREYCDRYPS